MNILQGQISIKLTKSGIELITSQVKTELDRLVPEDATGLVHIFIKHTSASIGLGERADPAVRRDLEGILNQLVPQAPDYEHRDEGPDDMPAHGKNAIIGQSLTLPLTRGELNLGTWQGIYLYEHLDVPRSRQLVITVLL